MDHLPHEMKKLVYVCVYIFLLLISFSGVYAQCPQIIDGNGVPSTNPQWSNCNGNPFTINVQPATNLSGFNINWGDGATQSFPGGLASSAFIQHTYPVPARDTSYIVTITQASPACIITGLAVIKRPPRAGIIIAAGEVNQVCAPQSIRFVNTSQDVDTTTIFVVNFGDGVIDTLPWTSVNQVITHQYLRNTTSCNTSVSITAIKAGCLSSTNTYSPILIWDLDSAIVNPSRVLLCDPDRTVTFSNGTIRNCAANATQGNTSTRYEKWIIHNFKGPGIDSVIDWRPSPQAAVTVTYPGIGTYCVTLLDSSYCGIDTSALTCISIVSPPHAGVTASKDTICEGESITFTNLSTTGTGYVYTWNFGDGSANVVTTSNAPQTHAFTTDISVTTTRNVTLQVQVPGANAACSDIDTVRIVVEPTPKPNFSLNGTAGNIQGCDSLLVNFADLSTDTAAGSVWLWDLDGNNVYETIGKFPAPVMFYATTPGNSTTYTIRLKITRSNGCENIRTRTVTIHRSPVPGFAANSVCVGQVAHFQDTSVFYPQSVSGKTYQWDFDNNGTIDATGPTPSHTFTTTGTFSVRLVISSSQGCPVTVIRQLVIESPPIAAFTPSVTSGCSPLSVTFTNGSTNSVNNFWKLGSGGTSTDVSVSRVYVNNSTKNDTIPIRLIAQTAFGCMDSVTHTIIVYPNPVASFTANALPSCNPQPIYFLNTSSQATQFEWDFGDGTAINTLPSPNHAFANNTSQIAMYTVTLRSINAFGCADTFRMPVLVYPQQTFTIQTDVDTGCTPLTVKFPAFPGIVSYDWDFGDLGSSTATAPTHTYVNNTTSDITYTARAIMVNAFGCRDTVTKDIVVHPLPRASFTQSAPAGCTPLDISFQNTSTGALSYHWDYGDGTEEHTSTMTTQHRYINTSDQPLIRTVILRAYNGDSCVDQRSQTVTVFPPVQASFQINPVACSPYVFTADNQSSGASKYYWYLDGSLMDSVQHRVFAVGNSTNAAQLHQITLRAVSVYGCTHDTSFTITVLPKPHADFMTDVSSGCQPLTVNMTNLSTPGIKYYWDFGNGIDSFNTVTFARTYYNSTANPIVHDVRLIALNADGCSDTLIRQVTVFPFISTRYNSDTVGCSPFSFDPDNQSVNTSSHAWYVDNVLVSAVERPTISLVNTGNTARTFVLRLESSSAFGCSEAYSKSIIVHPSPVADFDVPNPVIKFPLNTFNIINRKIEPNVDYLWDFGDNTTSNVANPGTHSYTQPGVYTIRLIVSNALCSDTLDRIVTVEPPLPIAAFTGGGDQCAPYTIQFRNQTLYATSYEWDFGDGETSTRFEPQHTYRLGGTYTVRLTATGPGGQDIEVHLDSVTVYDNPNAYFVAQPAKVFIPSDPIVLFNLSTNASTYLWDFGDGITSTLASPEHYYTRPGDYTVTLIATNQYGCKDTFTYVNAVRAEATGSMQVPNAFTPNPNGPNGGQIRPGIFDNDIFYPMIRGAKEYYLAIYNRWGELIFESRDAGIGWDGYYRGQLCKQDVYVWRVEAVYSDGRKETKSGDLLLLR